MSAKFCRKVNEMRIKKRSRFVVILSPSLLLLAQAPANAQGPGPVIDQLGSLGMGSDQPISGEQCSPEVSQELIDASTRAQKTRLSLLTLFNDKGLEEFGCLDSILNFKFTGELAVPSLTDIIQVGGEAVCNVANEFIQQNLTQDIRVSVPGVSIPGGIIVGGGGFDFSSGASGGSSGPQGVNLPGGGQISGGVSGSYSPPANDFDVPTFLPSLNTDGGGS